MTLASYRWHPSTWPDRFNSVHNCFVAAGTLSKEILSATDDTGTSIAQTLDIPECSTKGAKCSDELVQQAVKSMQLPSGSVHAYIEVHLEQGPVLEATGTPVGVVGAIVGQSRWLVSLQGEQGHAGMPK
jgi:hypothetical protein